MSVICPSQSFDKEMRLFHNGFRYYNANVGRYTQSDPLGLEAGWNTYAYVAGNLVSAVDYLGLEASWSRKTADFLWGINSSLTFGLSDLFAKPDSVCTDSEYYTGGVYTADAVTLVVAPVKGAVNTGVKKTVGKYAVGSHSQMQIALKNSGLVSHYIIQNAAVKNLPGYSQHKAPTIGLTGRSSTVGSEHYFATNAQRKLSNGGGTYASERRLAYRGLREAGLSVQDAKGAVRYADEYFKSINVKPTTKTNIPGNRK